MARPPADAPTGLPIGTNIRVGSCAALVLPSKRPRAALGLGGGR